MLIESIGNHDTSYSWFLKIWLKLIRTNLEFYELWDISEFTWLCLIYHLTCSWCLPILWSVPTQIRGPALSPPPPPYSRSLMVTHIWLHATEKQQTQQWVDDRRSCLGWNSVVSSVLYFFSFGTYALQAQLPSYCSYSHSSLSLLSPGCVYSLHTGSQAYQAIITSLCSNLFPKPNPNSLQIIFLHRQFCLLV